MAFEPAVSRCVRGAPPGLGRRRGGDPLRRGERRLDLRLHPFDRARGRGRRHADAGLPHSGRRSRRCDAPVGGDDPEDGGRRHAARRRQGGARRARAAGGRGPAAPAAAVRATRLVARWDVPHRGRHEHHACRSRRRGRDVPVGVRHHGSRRRQREGHRSRRPARHSRERRARLRRARLRGPHRPRAGRRRRRPRPRPSARRCRRARRSSQISTRSRRRGSRPRSAGRPSPHATC